MEISTKLFHQVFAIKGLVKSFQIIMREEFTNFNTMRHAIPWHLLTYWHWLRFFREHLVTNFQWSNHKMFITCLTALIVLASSKYYNCQESCIYLIDNIFDNIANAQNCENCIGKVLLAYVVVCSPWCRCGWRRVSRCSTPLDQLGEALSPWQASTNSTTTASGESSYKINEYTHLIQYKCVYYGELLIEEAGRDIGGFTDKNSGKWGRPK